MRLFGVDVYESSLTTDFADLATSQYVSTMSEPLTLGSLMESILSLQAAPVLPAMAILHPSQYADLVISMVIMQRWEGRGYVPWGTMRAQLAGHKAHVLQAFDDFVAGHKERSRVNRIKVARQVRRRKKGWR